MAIDLFSYEATCPACGLPHRVQIQVWLLAQRGPGMQCYVPGSVVDLDPDLRSCGYLPIRPHRAPDPLRVLEDGRRCGEAWLGTEIVIEGGRLAELRLVALDLALLERVHVLPTENATLFWAWLDRQGGDLEDELRRWCPPWLDLTDLDHQLALLADEDPRKRARTLAAIAGDPTADSRLLAACERLMEDETITLLGLPYRFGEVRWHAADAVAAVRGALGLPGEVTLANVVVPLGFDEVVRLAVTTGCKPRPSGVDSAIGMVELLVHLDEVPRRTITRGPPVPA